MICTCLMLLQGVGAVVGAVSRNLHELQDRQGSYLSIYDQPSLPLQVSLLIDALKISYFYMYFCMGYDTIVSAGNKLLMMYSNIC